ncbi:MAG: hypothetical protein ACJ8C4_16360 [Gemmataceae bacterium]
MGAGPQITLKRGTTMLGLVIKTTAVDTEYSVFSGEYCPQLQWTISSFGAVAD